MTRKSVRRENVDRAIRHGTRGESASRCIGPITKRCDIFGITKGDFSMVDILRHIVSEIGPCDVDIGTWTAANADISIAEKMFDEFPGKIRFLVDRSFPARQENYFRKMLNTFGRDSVRLARFHGKFMRIENAEFQVAVRTSMNLNLNKRIETYEISEGPEICGYLKEIVDYHFEHEMIDSYAAFDAFLLNNPVGQADPMDFLNFSV